MNLIEGLRVLLPLVPAVAVAWAVHLAGERRRPRPPGFASRGRHFAAMALLAVVFYFGVFLPLAWFGVAPEPDLSQVRAPELFLLHFLLAAVLVTWFVLGYSAPAGQQTRTEETAPPAPGQEGAGEGPGEGPGTALRQLWRQCGLAVDRVQSEVRLGLVAGLLSWAAVLATMAVVAALLSRFGETLVPEAPPQMVLFMAALPVWLRVALSLSAGLFEEVFFRGFLQPRIGILASTALFVLAHGSYGQPLMFVGITLLSLIFALLVRWRGNVWAAVVAHATFDGIQLLIVVPVAFSEGGLEAGSPVAIW